MANRLTIKGQVTIPKEIREFLGLSSGNQVEFQIGADGTVSVRKAAVQTKSDFVTSERPRRAAGRGVDVLGLLSGVCI
ncbi:MAG: type II toxin-antitoxin system PrlF family antitoxin [Sutterellaceae bacterium]|nr:type II toxin-antitoxin system PrlF family antitoxin [Sutterellaceae bacterium]MDD7441627.1 type II toxin-antitoxin system PrlF family antitoxin [Sutterellaceae bacterium]MDY2868978.1 type II toxin-antitoxin system PrlF family antitoxin [Mesosutterella sp.]